MAKQQVKDEEMVEGSGVVEEVDTFLENWPGAYQPVRDCFRLLYLELATMAGVTLNFSARPGVSYSLRPQHDTMVGREFFAIIDVIDEDQENRWLSVCFYQDLISDPEERGECIPGGLPGGDGYCFNLSGDDKGLADYLVVRLHEARTAAAGE